MTDWSAKPFYSAFIPTKDKKSIVKFKDTTENHYNLNAVCGLNEFAGLLAPNAVLLDADEQLHSDNLLKVIEGEELLCMVTERDKGRGIHALFLDDGEFIKVCGTHATLACGIVVDVKAGRRNSYEVLKFGVEREIIYDAFDDEEYQQTPKYFTPVKTNVDFAALGEGDGRNQALFNHILTLQSAGFEVEEARECIRIMNKYVLKTPISDSELDVILRDDAFKKPIFFKGNTFLFDKFAIFLKNNSHIVKINGQLHTYKDGVFVPGYKEIELAMVNEISTLSRTKRNEVLSYLEIKCDEVQSTGANLIAFRNGLYNIVNDEFMPFSPAHIITNIIPWDYNPHATNDLVDEVLNKISCQDPQIRMVLEELVGYCFYRRNELGKAFILVGDKSNGKSTFLDMVKTMLGEKNISALDLKEVNERFKTAELFGMLANVGDDIGDEFIPNTGIFKKLVTGDELTGERKGQDPFKFHSYAKLLFSANNIPRLGKGKDSAAIARRLVIIPFEARFSVDDPDYKPYIKYDLRKQSAMEYLIQLGLQGLKRVLYSQDFTKSSKVQRSNEDYERENNPILAFCDEYLEENKFDYEPTATAFEAYVGFCAKNNFKSMTSTAFSTIIGKRYDLKPVNKRISGKVCKCFVPIENSE